MTNSTLVTRSRPPAAPSLMTRVAGLWHAGGRGLHGDQRRRAGTAALASLNGHLRRDIGLDRSRS